MKKSVYKPFVFLVIPIVIQQIFSQALVFVDQIMIGHLGEHVVAALGTASQLSFFYFVAQFGVLSSGSLFISQYHGKKEHAMVQRIFGFMTIIALAFCVVLTIVFYFGSDFLFTELFKNGTESPALKAETARIGAEFMRIISLSFIMTTLSGAFSVSMRSIEKTVTPMIASSLSIALNIILNLILIPRYGAIGAAYGTLLSRLCELVFLFIIFLFTDNPFKTKKLSNYWITNRPLLAQIFKISIPVFLTELLWALATLIINLLYTQTGVEGAAASSISGLVLSLQSVIFMGVASATAIMVGKAIGEEGKSAAIYVAKKLTRLALVVTVVLVAVSYVFGINLIMGMYSFKTESASRLTYIALNVVTFMSVFKLINWFMFIGLFRAGGDTRFALIADVGFLYAYAIPAVAIGLYVFHLPVYMLIFLALIEEVLKVCVGTWRYLSQKWIHDVTRDIYHV